MDLCRDSGHIFKYGSLYRRPKTLQKPRLPSRLVGCRAHRVVSCATMSRLAGSFGVFKKDATMAALDELSSPSPKQARKPTCPEPDADSMSEQEWADEMGGEKQSHGCRS
jgi:hypothetical protein